MIAALLEAGIPAMGLQPAASAVCRGGKLLSMATGPIKVSAHERAFSEHASAAPEPAPYSNKRTHTQNRKITFFPVHRHTQAYKYMHQQAHFPGGLIVNL